MFHKFDSNGRYFIEKLYGIVLGLQGKVSEFLMIKKKFLISKKIRKANKYEFLIIEFIRGSSH